MPIPAPFNTLRPILPHPMPIQPIYSFGMYDIYHIDMRQVDVKLHPALMNKTTMWKYLNLFQSNPYTPTVIEARRGRPSIIIWHNDLPQNQQFPFNDLSIPMPHPHGNGNHCGGYVHTIGDSVPHLHGGEVPPQYDGIPTSPIKPGQMALYFYPNQQRASTLWFHDHTMDATAKNVYAGLAGLYLIRDEEEDNLNLPSGAYEWSLVLQDCKMDMNTGKLIYDPNFPNNPEFVGDHSMVNGQLYPKMEVEPTWYRIRLLNGANTRFYNLKFHVGEDDVNGDVNVKPDIEMWQIGSDGGLLSMAARVPSPPPGLNLPQQEGLLISPGERIDLLINFKNAANTTISLYSDIQAPFADFDSKSAQYFHVMAFDIKATTCSLYHFDPQTPLSNISPLPVTANTSQINLTEDMPGMPRINVLGQDKDYCDPITTEEQISLDSIHDFEFTNETPDSHPMHIHLVQFQVISGGTDLRDINNNPVFAWKDTVRVKPSTQANPLQNKTRVRAKFSPYPGRYVYHCHLLEHEDSGMMRPLEVI